MKVTGTVIHYTADGPEWNPVKWLCMPEAGASAHCVIERAGPVHRLVKLRDKAWHAGESEWLHRGVLTENVSRYTIGIEIANCGLLFKSKSGDFYWRQNRRFRPYIGPKPRWGKLTYPGGRIVEGYWEPYTDAAMNSLQELLAKLTQIGYGEAAQNLVGHEEISPERKSDPGPLFPWERFSRKLPKSTKAIIGDA